MKVPGPEEHGDIKSSHSGHRGGGRKIEKERILKCRARSYLGSFFFLDLMIFVLIYRLLNHIKIYITYTIKFGVILEVYT